ncbi:MAG: hypothetical protein Q7U16_12150 [Agitococcus sp.]|nr:hypothetical protein [Agitococcus sp.]
MFGKVCPSCHKNFRIVDVKVDKHWNSYSVEPAYCYCPYCNAILRNVYPSTVDFVKHFKIIYILPFVCFFIFFGVGVATNTLGYVAPLMLLSFGGWLVKSSKLKDHRIIGWFLVILSAIVFVAFKSA